MSTIDVEIKKAAVAVGYNDPLSYYPDHSPGAIYQLWDREGYTGYIMPADAPRFLKGTPLQVLNILQQRKAALDREVAAQEAARLERMRKAKIAAEKKRLEQEKLMRFLAVESAVIKKRGFRYATGSTADIIFSENAKRQERLQDNRLDIERRMNNGN